MKLIFDVIDNQFKVLTDTGLMPIIDFYIKARKEAGITISKLERDTFLDHPQLWIIESKPSTDSRSLGKILRALATLGYEIDIV